MTIKYSLALSQSSQNLTYVEFLEFLCRIAYQCKVEMVTEDSPFAEISGIELDKQQVNHSKLPRKMGRALTYTPPLWLWQASSFESVQGCHIL